MRAATLVALLALVAGSAGAEACTPSTSPATYTIGPLYVVDELCGIGHDCIGAFWIYAESNGIEGLQRDDAVQDDTCGGAIRADTLVV